MSALEKPPLPSFEDDAGEGEGEEEVEGEEEELEEERERERVKESLGPRHSLEGYDSSDELLATIAKV